jgi:hypothetical protein
MNDSKELLQKWIDAFNGKDIEAVMRRKLKISLRTTIGRRGNGSAAELLWANFTAINRRENLTNFAAADSSVLKTTKLFIP